MIFLDTNIIIYQVENREPEFAKVLVQLALLGSQPLAVSRLSELECLVKPLRDRNTELQAEYERFFLSPELHIVELSAAVLRRATHIRARHGVRTPDALVAACCLVDTPDATFFTNDTGFQSIDGLKVVFL